MGGKNCSFEESFYGKPKHQRAEKSVCIVNTNTVKK